MHGDDKPFLTLTENYPNVTTIKNLSASLRSTGYYKVHKCTLRYFLCLYCKNT